MLQALTLEIGSQLMASVERTGLDTSLMSSKKASWAQMSVLVTHIRLYQDTEAEFPGLMTS